MISNKIKREKGRKERENEREREREREREKKKERKNIKKDNIVRFGRWIPEHGYTNNLKREKIHLHI